MAARFRRRRPTQAPSRPPGTAVAVRVPAKINLFLAVRGLRDDGYHELVSVMQTVGLHDEVGVAVTVSPEEAQHPAARRRMRLELAHDAGEAVPDDDDNLALRAARLLLETLGSPPRRRLVGSGPVTSLTLSKRIPVAAGMAGGSADAAATLVALNDLWGIGMSRDELRDLGAELGADVPFCLHGGTAIATGTGTATAQVLTRGQYHWFVGIGDDPLATPDVYRTFDEVGTPSTKEPDAVLQALNTGDPEALGAALHNDLEQAAFHLRPELRTARDELLDAGALGAVLSGSGPTMLGLAASRAEAEELAERCGALFARQEVVASPAGGPEVHAVRPNGRPDPAS